MKTPITLLVALLLALPLSSCDQPPEEDSSSLDRDLVAEDDLGTWGELLAAWDEASCAVPNPAGPPPSNFAPAVLDSLGCQIWYPATFLALGTPGSVAYASDQNLTVYYSSMLVATPVDAWTYLDQVPSSLANQFGFDETTMLSLAVKDGDSGRTIDAAFGFLRGQTPCLGRARLFTGADAQGLLRSRLTVFWSPVQTIQASRCVFEQIDASVACPAGPGCNDQGCFAYCQDAFAAGLCLGRSCGCIP